MPPNRRYPRAREVAARLAQLDHDRVLAFEGSDSLNADLLVVRFDGRERVFSPDAMETWLDGLGRGRNIPQLVAYDRRDIEAVRRLLLAPGPQDQCRIALRYAMQAASITMAQMMAEIRATNKAINDSLRLGGTPGRENREWRTVEQDSTTYWECLVWSHRAMWDVLQGSPVRTLVKPQSVDDEVFVAPPGSWRGWREPAPLVRQRLLAFAHEQGLVRWVDPADPNRAYHTREFRLAAGGRVADVAADAVWPWLVGLADSAAPDLSVFLYEGGAGRLSES